MLPSGNIRLGNKMSRIYFKCNARILSIVPEKNEPMWFKRRVGKYIYDREPSRLKVKVKYYSSEQLHSFN